MEELNEHVLKLLQDEVVDEVSRFVDEYRVVVDGVAIAVRVFQVLGHLGAPRFVGVTDHAIWNKDAGQVAPYRSVNFKATAEEAASSAVLDMLDYYEPGHPEYWIKGQ